MDGDWSAWSDCDVRCGSGIKQRVRRVRQEPLNGGRLCPGNTVEKAVCEGSSCKFARASQGHQELRGQLYGGKQWKCYTPSRITLAKKILPKSTLSREHAIRSWCVPVEHVDLDLALHTAKVIPIYHMLTQTYNEPLRSKRRFTFHYNSSKKPSDKFEVCFIANQWSSRFSPSNNVASRHRVLSDEYKKSVLATFSRFNQNCMPTELERDLYLVVFGKHSPTTDLRVRKSLFLC